LVSLYYNCKKSMKIPKGIQKPQIERTDNTMAKRERTNNTMAKRKRTNNTMAKRERTNNELQNTKHLGGGGVCTQVLQKNEQLLLH